MSKKSLLLGSGFAAALALFANGLFAQDSSSSGSTPPPAPPPAEGAKPASKAPKVDLTKIPPASDKTNVSFATDIAPVLKTSCSACHGETKPKGGYSVLTATSILKDAKGHAMVVAGKSEKSPIVLYVSGAYTSKSRVMPPLDVRDKYPALTKEQIGLLRAWIDQGAKAGS